MSDQPRINGVAQSWASISLVVADQRYYGVKEITFGDKIEAPFGYGLGAAYAPQRQGRGKYSTDPVVLKCYRSTAEQIRTALAAQSPLGAYSLTECQIVINMVEIAVGIETPLIVIAERCRLLEEKVSDSESPELAEEELTFSTFAISRNGKYKFDITQGFF